MDSIKQLVKQLMKRAGLVPFFKCVCVYFVAGGGAGGGAAGAWGVLAKCAPVLCLLVFVLLQRAAAPATSESRAYAGRVCGGLGVSALADALLEWPGTAPLAAGMALFGAAHVAYIAAFGLRPLSSAAPLAAALYGAAAVYTRALRPPPALASLVPLYAALLVTMAWRGAARLHAPPPVTAASAACSAAGAILFLVSDAILAYSLFNGPVPYKQVVVMSTYYLGQLGIALSAAEQLRAPAPSSSSLPSVEH